MNPWIGQVSQKLFFARLALEQVGVQSVSKQDRHGHVALMLCQSAVFQLECAYRHHLREVAATYKCSNPENILTAEQLATELQSVGKHPAESSEMINLENQQGSWLQQLLVMRASFDQLPETFAIADNASPIALMQVCEEGRQPELTEPLVSKWMSALQELIERHREMMVEC